MDRRKFLAGLLASPILIPAVKYFLPPMGGWPVGDFTTDNLVYKSTERFSWGATDVRALYGSAGDGIALRSAAHPMSAEAFRAIALPTLNKIWSEEYDKHSDEWERLYGPEQLTLFDSLNPDTLEDIEIGYDEAADAAGRASVLPEPQQMAIRPLRGEFPSYSERQGSILLPRLLGLRKKDVG